jgi:hypothetical protein
MNEFPPFLSVLASPTNRFSAVVGRKLLYRKAGGKAQVHGKWLQAIYKI